ncbi:MAG TPA: hypothetical protein DDZ51_31450 [Planctomycetaceae bacterium]|nr:hypothetical protein [Planctomycetaceae bacterium]
MNHDAHDPPLQENVVERLRSKIRQARASGFIVRQELLGTHQSTWCEIGGRKMLFLDAAQPAREQIATIDEVMADYRADAKRSSITVGQPDR